MINKYYLGILVIVASSACGMYHHRDSKYLNHVHLVYQFNCSLPQLRAVAVEELLSVGPSPDEIFYPRETILARCGGAGCCLGENQVCGPIETRNVSLVFLVKHRIDQQRDRHHETLHVVEHTKCGCIDRDKNDFLINEI
ncbi:uncharacterized protein LOC107040005 [Diachasma alloeum]|uniref:uncharacterized protein LOC107040005 n=1 Tax=Diachasma alloeum TaxID=454923 RepID=UPI0007383996|nr:uncharacterized protein LOC107040005 [Diachasma alloeum]